MTVRLTTAAQALDVDAWTPTDESIFQLSTPTKKTGASVVVQIQGKVDTSADWVTVDTITPAAPISGRVAKLPYLRLSMSGNIGSGTITVWDNT